MSAPNPPRLSGSDLSSTLEGDLTASMSATTSEALQAAQDEPDLQLVFPKDIEQLRQSLEELKAVQQKQLNEIEERLAATKKEAFQAAQDAQKKADTANAAVYTANTRAAAADAIANTANTTANNASTRAAAAVATANTANTTANNANTTATNLRNSETSTLNTRRRLFP